MRIALLLLPLLLVSGRVTAAVPGYFLDIDGYDFDVRLTPQDDLLQVQSSVEITNHTFYPLDVMDLYFNQGAQFEDVRVNGQPASYEVTGSRQEGLKWLTFHFDPPIPVDDTVSVQVAYSVAIYARGLTQIEPGATTVLTESKWAPHLHDWDSEYGGDYAPVHMVLHVPPDETAVMPGNLLREERTPEGNTFEWESGLTILPAVVSGRYRTVEVDEGGSHAVGYLFTDMGASEEAAMRTILTRALDIYNFYTELYGPLPEAPLRICAWAREGGGYGMPRCLLLERGTFDFQGEPSVDKFNFLAHEIAHSWFPGLLRPRARGGGLMTEALATYSASLAVEHFMGPDKGRASWQRSQQRVAAVEKPAPLIQGGAQDLVYHKGAYFWRTLDRHLGHERLIGLLRTFAQSHRLESVPFDDFFAWLKEQTDDPWLDDLFRWYLTTNELANVGVDGPPKVESNGQGVSVEITVSTSGLAGLPFDVEVHGEDGSVVRKTATIGAGSVQRVVVAMSSPPVSVALDPDLWLLQSRYSDDHWPREQGAMGFYRHAAAAWRRGEAEAGLEPIAQALARQPENPQFLLMAGLLLQQTGDLPGAREQLTAALDHAPEGNDSVTRAWTLVALARVSHALGAIDDARAYLFQVPDTDETRDAYAEAQGLKKALNL
jgi:hypothetical protein